MVWLPFGGRLVRTTSGNSARFCSSWPPRGRRVSSGSGCEVAGFMEAYSEQAEGRKQAKGVVACCCCFLNYYKETTTKGQAGKTEVVSYQRLVGIAGTPNDEYPPRNGTPNDEYPPRN